MLFNVQMFYLTLLCVQFIHSVKVTELPPVLERAANSAYHLLFCCLLRYVCPSFRLMFGLSFGFWFGQFQRYINNSNFKPLSNLTEPIRANLLTFQQWRKSLEFMANILAYLFLFVVSIRAKPSLAAISG